MFDHIGIFVSDPALSHPLYEACLAPLGIRVVQRQHELNAMVLGGEADSPFLWVGSASGEYYGTSLRPDLHRPFHLAFRAPSREAVDAFHAKALELGGRDNGAPNMQSPGYYAAFVLDPDGNNIEAGYRE